MAALQRGGIVGRWGGGSLLGKLAVASRSPAGGSWTCRSQERTSNRFQKVDPPQTHWLLMKQTKNKKGFLQGEGGGGGTMMSRVAASSEFRAGVLSFGCVLALERATGNGYRKIRSKESHPPCRATRACLSYTQAFFFVLCLGLVLLARSS